MTLARAGGEYHPGEDNAVFDCKAGFSFFHERRK